MASALGAVRLRCTVSSPAPCVSMDPKRMGHHPLSFPCPREHTLAVKGPEQLFSPSHKQQHTKTLPCEGEQTSRRRLLPTALAGGDLGMALTRVTFPSPKTQWHHWLSSLCHCPNDSDRNYYLLPTPSQPTFLLSIHLSFTLQKTILT